MYEQLILTGPMGSGKSSLGQILAGQLGFGFIDLDHLIAQQAGKNINRIFHEDGEERFRQLETAVLESIIGQRQVVIATGGGAVLSETNRGLMGRNGLVVNLTAALSELVKRLEPTNDRPLLKGEEPLESRIKRIVEEREPFYAEADIRIDTTCKTLEDTAAEILAFYEQKRLENL